MGIEAMQKDKFHLKNGDLSAYALHCGYIQKRELSPGVEITLWHEGGPCFHVRAHEFNEGKRLFWFSSGSLTKCRKARRNRMECETANQIATAVTRLNIRGFNRGFYHGIHGIAFNAKRHTRNMRLREMRNN